MNKVQAKVNDLAIEISTILMQPAGNRSIGEAMHLGQELVKVQRKLNHIYDLAKEPPDSPF